MTLLRIGTRGSALALAQTRRFAAELARITGEAPEIVIVKTGGDKDRTSALADFGGVGAFTREIDVAQCEGAFEIAVHSLKDVPTQGREGLALAAVPRRAAVEDCLVARGGVPFAELPHGATLATGSVRRSSQALRLRPDLAIVPLRGNVDTRIRKVREGPSHATLLARAGLERLGRLGDATETMDVVRMLPAAGQGALAIVVRESAQAALEAVQRLDDAASRAEVVAERAVLAALGGGCHLPLGCLGRAQGDRLSLVARVVSPDGSRTVEDRVEGDIADAEDLGRRLGKKLEDAGARELMAAR